MAFNVAELPGLSGAHDITTPLAAGSLTISKAVVYKCGSDTIFQLTYSDSTTGYIKMGKNNRVKIGGATPQFDSGTEITWNTF